MESDGSRRTARRGVLSCSISYCIISMVAGELAVCSLTYIPYSLEVLRLRIEIGRGR